MHACIFIVDSFRYVQRAFCVYNFEVRSKEEVLHAIYYALLVTRTLTLVRQTTRAVRKYIYIWWPLVRNALFLIYRKPVYIYAFPWNGPETRIYMRFLATGWQQASSGRTLMLVNLAKVAS